jgi:hypothetical protein
MQSKSFFLFLILVTLQLIRDRYEKSSTSKRGSGGFEDSQSDPMLGRLTYLPIIYLCFSVFVLIRLTFFQFTLHTLLFASYSVFYWEDIKLALGLDKSYSFL